MMNEIHLPSRHFNVTSSIYINDNNILVYYTKSPAVEKNFYDS